MHVEPEQPGWAKIIHGGGDLHALTLFFYHLFCATEVKALSAQINLIEQKVIHGEGDIHELTHILCSTEV